MEIAIVFLLQYFNSFSYRNMQQNIDFLPIFDWHLCMSNGRQIYQVLVKNAGTVILFDQGRRLGRRAGGSLAP